MAGHGHGGQSHVFNQAQSSLVGVGALWNPIENFGGLEVSGYGASKSYYRSPTTSPGPESPAPGEKETSRMVESLIPIPKKWPGSFSTLFLWSRLT